MGSARQDAVQPEVSVISSRTAVSWTLQCSGRATASCSGLCFGNVVFLGRALAAPYLLIFFRHSMGNRAYTRRCKGYLVLVDEARAINKLLALVPLVTGLGKVC